MSFRLFLYFIPTETVNRGNKGFVLTSGGYRTYVNELVILFFLENSLCLIFYKPAATSYQHSLITSQPLSGSFGRKLDNDLSLMNNF